MRIPETATGEFEAGNPATGKPGSMLTSLLMNSWLRELLAVLHAASMEVDPADDGQLAKAILAIVAQRTKAASEQVAGLIRIATKAQAQGLVDDTAALTALKLVDAFKVGQVLSGINTNQPLPGGLILKTGVYYQGSASSQRFSTPFPNVCSVVVGAESAVPAGQAGYVVVQFAGMDREGFNPQLRTMDGLFPNAATVRYFALGY